MFGDVVGAVARLRDLHIKTFLSISSRKIKRRPPRLDTESGSRLSLKTGLIGKCGNLVTIWTRNDRNIVHNVSASDSEKFLYKKFRLNMLRVDTESGSR